MIDDIPLSIPANALVNSGLDTAFVAQFSLFLGILLLSTIFFGKLFKKLFRIPVTAGQIIGGIILGPSVINIKNFSLFAKPLHIIDNATGKLFAIVSGDLFVFFVAMITLRMVGITTKYTRFSHLIGGALMVVIGILLIFKPSLPIPDDDMLS